MFGITEPILTRSARKRRTRIFEEGQPPHFISIEVAHHHDIIIIRETKPEALNSVELVEECMVVEEKEIDAIYEEIIIEEEKEEDFVPDYQEEMGDAEEVRGLNRKVVEVEEAMKERGIKLRSSWKDWSR